MPVTNLQRQAGPSNGTKHAPKVKDGGGPVIKNVKVQPIFWGQAWNFIATLPLRSQFLADATEVLTGPYMSGLRQYRDIGHGSLLAPVTISSPLAHSPADPPDPFLNDNIKMLVFDMIAKKLVPSPAKDPDLLYFVVLPPGVSSAAGRFAGEHLWARMATSIVRFAWLRNDGSRETLSIGFSHEVVESVTNPEGTGFQADSANTAELIEIADICEGIDGIAEVNGVMVQKYWSVKDAAGIAPGG